MVKWPRELGLKGFVYALVPDLVVISFVNIQLWIYKACIFSHKLNISKIEYISKNIKLYYQM